MADTSNLTNYLKDVAAAIKKKKGTTEPILAANFDIEIETINVGEGTVENGDVKLFTSVEEMNNYIGANSGDLAVVYSTKAVSVASGTKFSNLYFPKTMSIPKRTLTQPTVTATGDADITVVFTSTSVTFSIKYPKCPYTFTVLYELSEGTTYVRNDTYSDSPFNAAELNEYGFIWSNELLIFPASVSVTFTMPTLASKAVKAAFRYGELIFDGMYQYKSSKWTIADNQFSVKENDVISGKTAYGPYGLITGTRPVVAMELVEDVKYEPMTNYVCVTMSRDVAINTGGILTIKGAVVADEVGLTGDKIVAGNTILGVKGTASAGGSVELGEYSATFISNKPYSDGSTVKVLYTNDENKLDTIPEPAPFSGKFNGYTDITEYSYGTTANITTDTVFTANKVYRASNTDGQIFTYVIKEEDRDKCSFTEIADYETTSDVLLTNSYVIPPEITVNDGYIYAGWKRDTIPLVIPAQVITSTTMSPIVVEKTEDIVQITFIPHVDNNGLTDNSGNEAFSFGNEWAVTGGIGMFGDKDMDHSAPATILGWNSITLTFLKSELNASYITVGDVFGLMSSAYAYGDIWIYGEDGTEIGSMTVMDTFDINMFEDGKTYKLSGNIGMY